MADTPAVVCRRIRVRGQVQGVGFRPHVWRLARELGLVGWVRNDAAGVEIEAQGARPAVDALIERLQHEPPPLARVAAVESRAHVLGATAAFVIERSGGGPASAPVTPDSGVCADCLRELFDPLGRRWRHAFVNCTHCGPRYTIATGLPYDRPATSMAAFAMCADCRREYESPADRRFHAQPLACPACGPRLSLCGPDATPLDAGADPLAAAVARLARGEIVAVKGVGGYHLACDARRGDAVALLRARKSRDEKPFALMLANAASAEPFAIVSAAEREALEAPERPIVLLRKRSGCDSALPGVAPGLAWLGVMLPAAPLHHLLFHESAGRPHGTGWLDEPQPLALVLTSANLGGEPIVRDDDEALARLGGIADAWLRHDRGIVARCDDSVLRLDGAERQFVRRSRGWTPRAVALARAGPSTLAFGGGLKNAVCATRGDQAYVSAHVGDLDNAATCRALDDGVERLLALLRLQPERLACDRHPDLYSSRLAADWAVRRGLPLVEVQHHHAHIAAVAAEHGLQRPLLGLALDGVGLGDDGRPWGGELLWVDGASMRRLGHFASLALAGSDRAAREPWRMAAAALHALGRGGEIAARFAAQPAAARLAHLLDRGLHAPPTTSAGRWFDAAAALLGLQPVASFEGQAAMRLEGLAERHGAAEPLPDGWRIGADNTLDPSPLIAWVADAVDAADVRDAGGAVDAADTADAAGAADAHDAGEGGAADAVRAHAAAVFHATLAAALADWAIGAARAAAVTDMALGGGCWLNRVLSTAVTRRLRRAGMRVWQARQLPPNDGGLCLGQAWVALQTNERR